MSSEADHGGGPDTGPPEPWDIGGPQPAVQQLVAHGALRGEVLDPGTGPGHHAIHYAAQGYSVTGIDHSPAAIAAARRNAERAGVTVDFQVSDAVDLVGFDARFDTVVDSAFYHAFADDEVLQLRYASNLHRVTRPGARLFMFEAGRHNINGWQLDGLRPEVFVPLLGAAGWRVDHLSPTSYQGRFDPNSFSETLAQLEAMGRPDLMAGVWALQQRFAVLQPLLDVDNLVHMPFWAISATRLD